MSLFDRDNNAVKHSNYKLAADQMRIDFRANANANANSQLQYTAGAFPKTSQYNIYKKNIHQL